MRHQPSLVVHFFAPYIPVLFQSLERIFIRFINLLHDFLLASGVAHWRARGYLVDHCGDWVDWPPDEATRENKMSKSWTKDALVQGMVTKVLSNGRIAVAVRVRVNGNRAPMVKIGQLGQPVENGGANLNIHDARARAARLIENIKDDPDYYFGTGRNFGQPSTMTVRGAWQELVSQKTQGPKPAWRPNTLATNETAMKNALDGVRVGTSKSRQHGIGRLLFHKIKTANVMRIIDAMRAMPTQGNRTRALLLELVGFARQQGWIDRNTARDIQDDVAMVRRHKEAKNVHPLASHQIAPFMQAIEMGRTRPIRVHPEFSRSGKRWPTPPMPNPAALDIIELMLWCGARSSEIKNLKWGMITARTVHVQEGDKFIKHRIDVIEWPDAKGKPKTLPITDEMAAIINRQPGPKFKSEYVFPASKTKAGGATIQYVFRDLIARANVLDPSAEIEGVTPHSLRRTYITEGRRAGIDVEQLGLVANHAQAAKSATEIYIHANLIDVRAVMETVAGRLRRLAFPGANVVPFNQQALGG